MTGLPHEVAAALVAAPQRLAGTSPATTQKWSRFRSGAIRAALQVLAVALLLARPASAQTTCTGDCNGDGVVSVDELLNGVNILLGAADLSTCARCDANGDGRLTIDELVAAVDNALQGCARQTAAFVVTSDLSEVGSFGTIGLDSPHALMPSSNQHRIYQDAVARVHDGLVYVLNRLFADNIQVVDPARAFTTRLQCSTGNGTNPHDIAFVSPSKAYVTRFETPELLIINPSAHADCQDFMLGTIDLSSLADADGNPDMDQMAIVDGLLYVSLERLNINSVLRTPAENGALAIVDTATDTLIGAIELSGENPFAETKGLTVQDGAIYVAEDGLLGVIDQSAGIERVDLATRQAQGFIATEQDLGGDVTDFALVSNHLAYAVVSTPTSTNALVAFDPATGQITKTVAQSNGFNYFDIELNDRGEIYLADRSLHAPGVRIFRAADGIELTSAPLDLILPPTEIVFIP